MPSRAEAHIEALAVLAAEARERGVKLLLDRWAQLDHSDPVVLPREQFSNATSSQTSRECWVASHQITGVDEQGRWGEINNRFETYQLNMESLAACESKESFATYLADLTSIQLRAHPGPLGPLFTAVDGRHRTHILKALALPPVLIHRVIFPEVAHQAGDLAHVGIDFQRHHVPLPLQHPSNDQPPHEAASRRMDQIQTRQAQETLEHVQALEANGVITDVTLTRLDRGDYIDARFTLTRDLLAYWALELPAHVERLSRRYAHSYPEFTATPERAAMCDQTTWTNHLLGPAER